MSIKTPFEFTHNLNNVKHNELSGIIEAIGRHIEGGYMQYGVGRNDPICPPQIRILLNDRYPESLLETAKKRNDLLLEQYRTKLNAPSIDVIILLIFREESQELLPNQIHVAFDYGKNYLKDQNYNKYVTTSAGVVRSVSDETLTPDEETTGPLYEVPPEPPTEYNTRRSDVVKLIWNDGKNQMKSLDLSVNKAYMLGGHIVLQDKVMDIPSDIYSAGLSHCRYQYISKAMSIHADKGILLTVEDDELVLTNLSTQRIDLQNGQMALASKSSASLSLPETLIMGPFKLKIISP